MTARSPPCGNWPPRRPPSRALLALACLANDAPLTGGGDPTDRAFLDAAAAAGLAVRAASRQ